MNPACTPLYSDVDSETRATRWTASVVGPVLVALFVSAHGVASASTVYWRFTPILWADTVAPTDLNDLGRISYVGFGDPMQSAIGTATHSDPVRGYGYWGGDYYGVSVRDINNAGDAYGAAIRLDGVTVPTIWIGGVPYDLTDPANAGLQFDYDPGPKYALNFDLSSLPIIGLPFVPDDVTVSPSALTNARGDYVFEYYYYYGFKLYGLLTAVVPEPGTLLLVLAGLAAGMLLAPGRLRTPSRGAPAQDEEILGY
jgi:hypothetical protein